MNEITFDIRHTEFGEVVVPEIDGRSLISIIRDVEMPCTPQKVWRILQAASHNGS